MARLPTCSTSGLVAALLLTACRAAPQWFVLVTGGAEPGGRDGTATLALDAASGALTLVSRSDLGAGTGGWTSAAHATGEAADALPSRAYATRRAGGSTQAVRVNATGGMAVNGAPQPAGGDDPEHALYVPGGSGAGWVLSALYGSGRVGVQPVNADGSVGPPRLPAVTAAAWAHEIALDPTNATRVFVPCKGADVVLQFDFDAATGVLAPAPVPRVAIAAGSGPRHIVFHPTLRAAFIVNELASTVATLSYDAAAGSLAAAGATYVSALPPGTSTAGQSAAEVLVAPDGTIVYATSRGDAFSGVAAFRVVDPGGGGPLSLGPATFYAANDPPTYWTRAMTFAAGGRLAVLAGEKGGCVAVYSRDAGTGALVRLAVFNLTGIVDGPSWVGAFVTPAAP